MVAQCRENLKDISSKIDISVEEVDIRELNIENSSVVTLNYTLQFIPVEDRDNLIKKIYNGLNPGGALILSEKIFANCAKEQTIIEELHRAFKQANGYSDLEISQKRTALENVLIPEDFNGHKERLLNAGFSNVIHWFQCMNFHSILAIK